MAIAITSEWRLRSGGNDLNGGGFDPAIAAAAGVGADQTDNDVAAFSKTDLLTTGAGSTNLVSSGGGFTNALVGNCWRISAGTNFTPGYYFVTAFVDANTLTLDRSPTPSGAGSAGVGRIGGAWAGWGNIPAGAGSAVFPAPAIATPIAGGHTIWIRGSGQNDPTNNDWDFSGFMDHYGNMPMGSMLWPIKQYGYNGRPKIQVRGMLWYNASMWDTDFLKVVHSSAAGTYTSAAWPIMPTGKTRRCIIDMNGHDMNINQNCILAEYNDVRNSGSRAVGSANGFWMSNYNHLCAYNRIDGFRGYPIYGATMCTIIGNQVTDCGRACLHLQLANEFGAYVSRNVFDGSDSHGIVLVGNQGTFSAYPEIRDNLITNNGGYGITHDGTAFTAGVTYAEGQRSAQVHINGNAFYNNTSGPRSGAPVPVGADDMILTASPYVDRGSGDFNINNVAGGGAVLRARAHQLGI